MIRNPGAEPEQRFCQFRGSHNAMNKSGRWMDFSHCAALLHIDRASRVVDRVDSSERAIRRFKGISFSNLCVLRRELVTIDRTLFRATDPSNELQARYPVAFF